MTRMNWPSRAVESEIAISVALGGIATGYNDFTHVYNPSVRWCGDFNRAVGVKAMNRLDFQRIQAEVTQIHQKRNLDVPDHFDVHPNFVPYVENLTELTGKDSVMQSDVFCMRDTRVENPQEAYRLALVNQDEYMKMWMLEKQAESYFDEDWSRRMTPLQCRFIQMFKPYWLFKGDECTARLQSAHLDGYVRLFDVSVDQKFQGRGLGKILMQAICHQANKDGASHILIRCSRSVLEFYEKCGFAECCRGLMVRCNS